MPNYAKHVSRKVTPQNQKASSKQKKNNAGGYTFVIDDWARLDRFLVLGSEGGTYYVSENKLTKQNAKCIERLLKTKRDGLKLVEHVAKMSEDGRAPKNDPAIFALAMAASCSKDDVRKAALEALPRVCRTGTHLFHFAAMVNELRGWGRGLRKAVANWYNSKPVDRLAYQLVKYQQRDGWSNRDLLRLSHAGTDAPSDEHNAAYRWVVSGAEDLGKRKVKRKGSESTKTVKYAAVGELPRLIQAYEEIKAAKSEKKVVKLITKHNLTHEMVPTQFKNSPAVWEALLEKMPVTAMIRNLGKMTSIGVVKPLSGSLSRVTETLTNVEALKRARVHPLSVLTALKIYSQGRGMKGSLTWKAVPQVVDALDEGFYLAFDAIEPTGQNILLALDVSGSMCGARIAGSPLSAREASAAMAMATARSEKNYYFVGFTGGGLWNRSGTQSVSNLTELKISKGQRLDTVVNYLRRLPMGGTDCALPMLWAKHTKAEVDAFCIYTDNETWAGKIHAHQALKQYRDQSGRNAKCIVTGMTATKFSIANPDDVGMMDVVGFDTSAPAVIADFIRK
jgi:60 kDa SS-A/Ro ribonucleoprotein